jgi:hypothetical protein
VPSEAVAQSQGLGTSNSLAAVVDLELLVEVDRVPLDVLGAITNW